MIMDAVPAVQKKRRRDFIPYFLGFVLFLYASVHLISFTAKRTQENYPTRVRRALGKHMQIFWFMWVIKVFVFSRTK